MYPLSHPPAQCTPSPKEFQLPVNDASVCVMDELHVQPTFLMSGTLGVKRCDSWDIVSSTRAWFFIVFLAFMILDTGINE